MKQRTRTYQVDDCSESSLAYLRVRLAEIKGEVQPLSASESIRAALDMLADQLAAKDPAIAR